tara:strand:+ start:22274 stop:22717 length:444 start_codon:yes stop_codon:yes gene_type:complete
MDSEQIQLHNAIVDNRFPVKFVSPFSKSLNAELLALDIDAGTISCQFQISNAFTHGGGVIQGGILSAMLDFTMAMLCLAGAEKNSVIATTDLHAQFLAPSTHGRFICQATFVRKGRKTAFTRAELKNASDMTVASAIATNIILQSKK